MRLLFPQKDSSTLKMHLSFTRDKKQLEYNKVLEKAESKTCSQGTLSIE